MSRPKGWTGLGRGAAMWHTPELRVAELERRKSIPLADRFERFVIRRDDGCWGWSGCHNGVGYGVMRVNKKLRMATHVSLELSGRERPSGKHLACHHCDNPICTNPDHLFWGTASENTIDGYRKGRIKTPTERNVGAPIREARI